MHTAHCVCLCVCVFSGLETDGIYRVSGNLAVIQKLRFAVNHGKMRTDYTYELL